MKGQDNLQSTSVKINREVNIYINFWIKFPLHNKALKFNRQPTLGIRGFSRVWREFSLLAEGRHRKRGYKKFLSPRVPSAVKTGKSKPSKLLAYLRLSWSEHCNCMRLNEPNRINAAIS